MRILKKLFFQESDLYYDAKHKIWSGKSITPLFHENMSIGQVALFVLGLNPHKVIQKCDTTGEELTSQALAEFGTKVAQSLKAKLGIQQEDIIGIMASNTTYLAPVALGAFLSGTPIHPVHHTFDSKAIATAYSLTKPKVVFCNVGSYNELKQGLDDIGLNCKIYTINGRIDDVECVQDLLCESDTDEDFVPEMLKNGGDQTAAILCTSGTTGVPKGVCVSHRTLLGRQDFLHMTPDDVLFTFSPLYWITGLWTLMRTFVIGAFRVITEKPYSPELLFNLIEKYKITQILAPPAHASLSVQCPDIAKRDLSSVRTFICGGAPLSVSVAKNISKYLRKHCLCEGYGLSELGGISHMNRLLLEKEGSVGQLNPNTKGKIVAEDGEPLGIGEVGAILLWSPFKWSGYYGKPDITKLAIEGDGWIKTGDLGYFDEEGFLFVCGRQKDILRHRHFLIAPVEIEEVIHKIPGVVEACVFGTPHQMEEDLITAAVIRSPGCNLTEEDICKAVASTLPEIKHLRGGVYFVDELPRTPSGKVQKHKLLTMVEELSKAK